MPEAEIYDNNQEDEIRIPFSEPIKFVDSATRARMRNLGV